MELLGSTETTGPQSACLPGAGTRPASVGRSFPQVETRISCPGGDGEERGAMDLLLHSTIYLLPLPVLTMTFDLFQVWGRS